MYADGQVGDLHRVGLPVQWTISKNTITNFGKTEVAGENLQDRDNGRGIFARYVEFCR
jgi:hypothetical protein